MAYCSPGFLDDHHFDRRLHLRTTAVLLLSLPLFSVSYTRISELVYTAVEIWKLGRTFLLLIVQNTIDG